MWHGRPAREITRKMSVPPRREVTRKMHVPPRP